jgi:hypothetical protein
MKRKIILFVSILSCFLFITLPQIPAIDYSMSREKTRNLATQLLPEDITNNEGLNKVVEERLNKIDEIHPLITSFENILSKTQSNFATSSIFGTILKFILSIIVLVLNILISVISIVSGLANKLFSTMVNLIVSIIKKILDLGTFIQKILDIAAIVITGLFGIILNLVVGFLTLIKDIIVTGVLRFTTHLYVIFL